MSPQNRSKTGPPATFEIPTSQWHWSWSFVLEPIQGGAGKIARNRFTGVVNRTCWDQSSSVYCMHILILAPLPTTSWWYLERIIATNLIPSKCIKMRFPRNPVMGDRQVMNSTLTRSQALYDVNRPLTNRGP